MRKGRKIFKIDCFHKEAIQKVESFLKQERPTIENNYNRLKAYQQSDEPTEGDIVKNCFKLGFSDALSKPMIKKEMDFLYFAFFRGKNNLNQLEAKDVVASIDTIISTCADEAKSGDEDESKNFQQCVLDQLGYNNPVKIQSIYSSTQILPLGYTDKTLDKLEALLTHPTVKRMYAPTKHSTQAIITQSDYPGGSFVGATNMVQFFDPDDPEVIQNLTNLMKAFNKKNGIDSDQEKTEEKAKKYLNSSFDHGLIHEMAHSLEKSCLGGDVYSNHPLAKKWRKISWDKTGKKKKQRISCALNSNEADKLSTKDKLNLSAQKSGFASDYSCQNASEDFAEAVTMFLKNKIKNETPRYESEKLKEKMIFIEELFNKKDCANSFV